MNLRRTFRLVAYLSAAALACCGGPGPIAGDDLALRVGIPEASVAPGQGFPLVVTRSWSRSLAPADWSDRALSPLVVVLDGVERREDDRAVEEVRRYRAHAFSRSDVTLAPIVWTAARTDGGAARSVTSPAVRVRVVPTVPAESPGVPELPEAPRAARPDARLAFAAIAAVLLLATAVVLVRRRRPAAAAIPSASALEREDPVEVARRRLAALGNAPDPAHDVAAAADLLRDHVEATADLPARRRTTEEVARALGGPRGVTEPERLVGLLARADVAKFAGSQPTHAERDTYLTDARAFVEAQRTR